MPKRARGGKICGPVAMRIWGGDRTDGYGGVKEGAVSVLGTQLIPRIQGGVVRKQWWMPMFATHKFQVPVSPHYYPDGPVFSSNSCAWQWHLESVFVKLGVAKKGGAGS